jgi:hypothetical protein
MARYAKISWVISMLVGMAMGCSAEDGTRRGAASQVPAGGVGGSGAGGFGGAGGPGAGAGGGVPQDVVGAPLPATSTPFVRDDTGGSGLDQGTLDALKLGGASCTTKLLYPYANTIFPNGIISPPFQWEGATEAAYVRIGYAGTDLVRYEFAVGPSDPGELRVPQEAWNEVGRRASDKPLLVTLSVKSAGAVSTCELPLVIAPGVMKGSVYYNTYSAPGARNLNQGAVMRITIGLSDAEIYEQYNGTELVMSGTGPCISCHSVSANGTTMVASLHNYALSIGGGDYGGGNMYYQGGTGGGTMSNGKSFKAFVYPVQDAPEPPSTMELPNAEFSALYPDGSRVLTMGNPQCTGGSDTFPRAPNNFPLVEGPDHARVLDTRTGMEVPSSGLNPDWYMWMPQFSPDGKMVAFNHAKPDGAGGNDRRELAVMDYDYATNTFSNLRVVASRLGVDPSVDYMPALAGAGATGPGIGGCMIPAGQSDVGAIPRGSCTGPCYPGYPFFTPDSKGIVFSLTSEPDFASAFPGRDAPATSELWYTRVDSGMTVRLDRANASLDPKDLSTNYFPTVLPVQVGGYFWAFWTSRRSFGNKLDATATVLAGLGLPPGFAIPGIGGLEAIKKRIWVTAIRPPSDEGEFAGAALVDPSAPGFYLEGQSESGNVRAFATLAPCVGTGAVCTSGLDCCSGFCHVAEGAFDGTCTEEVPMCSKLDERCDTAADCCPPAEGQAANLCLGGYCGFIKPPE